MVRFNAVAFDMDGLMFDTERLYFEIETRMLGRRSKVMTQELAHAMMGKKQRDALQVMISWNELDDTVDDLESEREELYFELAEDFLKPMDGLFPLLEQLQNLRIPHCVATSASRLFAKHALGRFNLSTRFSFILTAEDVAKAKPDPEIYINAARKFGIEASRMLVLEDSVSGLKAAKSAGAYAVCIPHEHTDQSGIGIADLVCDSLFSNDLISRLVLEKSE